LGIPQKSSGKVSQHWESPKKVLASFPNLGNVPKKFWQGFPTLGKLHRSSGEHSQGWDGIFRKKIEVCTPTNYDSGIVNRESSESKTVYFPLFIGI
jgi:hypothetical protein